MEWNFIGIAALVVLVLAGLLIWKAKTTRAASTGTSTSTSTKNTRLPSVGFSTRLSGTDPSSFGTRLCQGNLMLIAFAPRLYDYTLCAIDCTQAEREALPHAYAY